MTQHTLTHHEILRLIEPFTRRGRHVDLAATHRAERRLAFQPSTLQSETPALDGANEILGLDNPKPDVWRLTRTITLASGESATLTSEGAEPGVLLDRIESAPWESQFVWIGDVLLTKNYRLELASRAQGAPLHKVLASAEARLDGLTLKLTTSALKSYPAEIELTPQAAMPLDLPDDLLATLGMDWKVLTKRGFVWHGELRAPGREPERSQRIEAALDAGVAHLSRTLAEPPHRFHERFVRERWFVVLRRMTATLLLSALLAAGIALAFADIPSDTPLARFMLALPGFMFYAMFGLRELPRLEFPRPPRPSPVPSWFPPRAGGQAPLLVPDEAARSHA